MGHLAADAAAASAVSGPRVGLLVLLPLALLDVTAPLAEAGARAERTRAAGRRLAGLEGTRPAVEEPLVPRPAPAAHDLELAGVSAGWDGRPVLTGLALELPAGRRIGVVGPSGSGKSTLAALLLRFIDPSEGSVDLSGVPLRQLALDDVRRDVGLVDDDPYVFATTLAENIRLARPSATDADVEETLRRAHLGDWLDGLPDGLHTWLGDGHGQVSGGERARIGLARSLLLDQPVLVLDEPIAHLDRATAAAVAADLLDAADGRSLVWITHAEIGLDRMDDIIELTGAAIARRHPLPRRDAEACGLGKLNAPTAAGECVSEL
jgi:ATP-binding cassette subfamily C protein CydCD